MHWAGVHGVPTKDAADPLYQHNMVEPTLQHPSGQNCVSEGNTDLAGRTVPFIFLFFFFFFSRQTKKKWNVSSSIPGWNWNKAEASMPRDIFFFFFPILFLLCPGGNLKSYCAGTFARTREVLRVFPPACATPEYLLAPAWAVVPSLGAAPAT